MRALVVVACLGSIARADDLSLTSANEELGDQGIGGMVGVASGGRVTAGGVRVTGSYLYQLSDQDWFDGIASFTFGGGEAGCYSDRQDRMSLSCDHGLADGSALELAAGVRRMFKGQGGFRPFVRAAIGISYTRFTADELSGVGVPVHLGGGVSAKVADGVRLVAFTELTVGLANFGRGLETEPQLGLAVTAGAEFRLR